MTSLFSPVPVTKHAEFIAAVPATMFASMEPPFPQRSGLVLYPFEQWIAQAQQYLTIAQRKRLEKTPAYRQLLPYLMVTQPWGPSKLYGLYQRTKQVGEERLGGKYSIGFGGHIDLVDIVHTQSVIQLMETIALSAKREKKEEVSTHTQAGEPVESDPVITHHDALILDDSDEVGTVHVGLVCEAEFHPDVVLGCKEGELKWIGMFTIEQIIEGEYDLENWSRLLVNHLSRHSLVAER